MDSPSYVEGFPFIYPGGGETQVGLAGLGAEAYRFCRDTPL